MLRLPCSTCGSLFMAANPLADRPLCPACGTVVAAVKKHSRPKSELPPKPAASKSAARTGKE